MLLFMFLQSEQELAHFFSSVCVSLIKMQLSEMTHETAPPLPIHDGGLQLPVG